MSSSGGAGRSPRLPCEWVSEPGANLESCVSTGPAREWGLARGVASLWQACTCWVATLGSAGPSPCPVLPPLRSLPLPAAQRGDLAQRPRSGWAGGSSLSAKPRKPRGSQGHRSHRPRDPAQGDPGRWGTGSGPDLGSLDESAP